MVDSEIQQWPGELPVWGTFPAIFSDKGAYPTLVQAGTSTKECISLGPQDTKVRVVSGTFTNVTISGSRATFLRCGVYISVNGKREAHCENPYHFSHLRFRLSKQ